MALSAFAQTKEIKGTVTDPQGNPVVGASVMVAELKNVGTVTDVDGLFTVTLSEGQAADAKSLVVSCIGMTTVNVTIPVDGKPCFRPPRGLTRHGFRNWLSSVTDLSRKRI